MRIARTARRRWGLIALVGLVVLVLAGWTVLNVLLLPYPLDPLEWAFWTGREGIRVVWAALTGQSTNVDLFPG